jgi:uncharacterized protein YndB with AHSA1/START domain
MPSVGANATPAPTVAVSRDIAAPAETVWALIADLPRMGEWSPENTGGSWTRHATGPALDAHFRGSNRNGRRRWTTAVVVTRCEPGTCFEFAVSALGLAVARWTYSVEAHGSACRVTESYTDTRGRIAKALGGPVSGVADRPTHNRDGMERTLANLAATAESAT